MFELTQEEPEAPSERRYDSSRLDVPEQGRMKVPDVVAQCQQAMERSLMPTIEVVSITTLTEDQPRLLKESEIGWSGNQASGVRRHSGHQR